MYRVHFIPEKNIYEVEDSSEIIPYSPALNVIEEYPPERFQMHVLYNSRDDYGENSIFQVYVVPEKKRIGWIFPGQALLSNQHDYANDQYFLKYVYVSLYRILEDVGDIDEKEIAEKTFLVIDNENIDGVKDFNINDYIVSLYSYGYSFSGRGNLYSSIDTVQDKHLHLKPISKGLNEKKTYIQYLFREHIPQSVNPVSSFLFFYQIIEILISIVFDEIFRDLLKEIEEGVDVDLMQKKEKLIESVSEKQRIRRLFSNKVSVERSSLTLLGEACDHILDRYGQDKGDTDEDKLYSLRCMLIHRCYILDTESVNLINDVNDAFSAVVSEMLMSFK